MAELDLGPLAVVHAVHMVHHVVMCELKIGSFGVTVSSYIVHALRHRGKRDRRF
jgi:hypothetical protein